MTKKEMFMLAKEMVTNNKKCLKASFKKDFPYAAFKAVYQEVLQQKELAAKRLAERKKISVVAAQNKLRVGDFTNVVALLRAIDLKKYSTGHSMGYIGYLDAIGFQVSRVNQCITPPNSYKYRPTYGEYSIKKHRKLFHV